MGGALTVCYKYHYKFRKKENKPICFCKVLEDQINIRVLGKLKVLTKQTKIT